MTQTQPQQPLSDDPLAKLHKMSTTAGLGVGEYVAINPMSVAALVVGLASAMAMLDPILLAIPIIALVLGLIGFRQIRKSSGTQKGYVLVALGLVAALGFTGVVGAREIIRRGEEKVEKNAVVAIVDKFGDTVLAGQTDDAWNLFTPTFQGVFDKQQFTGICNTLKTGPSIGQITSMKSNRFVTFDTFPDTKDRFAQTMMVVQFQSKQDGSKFDDRYEVVLRKVNGTDWKIERLDTFFPPPKLTAPKGATDPNTPLTPARRNGNTQG